MFVCRRGEERGGSQSWRSVEGSCVETRLSNAVRTSHRFRDQLIAGRLQERTTHAVMNGANILDKVKWNHRNIYKESGRLKQIWAEIPQFSNTSIIPRRKVFSIYVKGRKKKFLPCKRHSIVYTRYNTQNTHYWNTN